MHVSNNVINTAIPVFVYLNIPRYITLYIVCKSNCTYHKLRKTCNAINLAIATSVNTSKPVL